MPGFIQVDAGFIHTVASCDHIYYARRANASNRATRSLGAARS
jgi:hypothetical protein